MEELKGQPFGKPQRKEWRSGTGKLRSRRRRTRALEEIKALHLVSVIEVGGDAMYEYFGTCRNTDETAEQFRARVDTAVEKNGF